MALVNCPDRHDKVSDRAPACPKCGCPIGGSRPGRVGEPMTVRVSELQFTRKWVKVLGVLSLVAFWGGFYVQQNVEPLVGTMLVIAGLVGGVTSSIAHWWLHA